MKMIFESKPRSKQKIISYKLNISGNWKPILPIMNSIHAILTAIDFNLLVCFWSVNCIQLEALSTATKFLM